MRVVYPRVEFCTDNAAMIALLGHLRLAAGQRDDLAIRARARWPMTELVPPARVNAALAASREPLHYPLSAIPLAASPMDIIFLTGLTTDCIIGIWDWERRVKQKVVIDLEMGADIRKAAASDAIEDTLDYKRVVEAPAAVRRRVAVPAGRDAHRAHRARSS